MLDSDSEWKKKKPLIFQGNKLDFHLAMSGEAAKNMYFDLLSELKKGHCEEKIKDGQFGANMEVNIANDGPVTIELESLSQTSTKEWVFIIKSGMPETVFHHTSYLFTGN